jgi:hypothetical protein
MDFPSFDSSWPDHVHSAFLETTLYTKNCSTEQVPPHLVPLKSRIFVRRSLDKCMCTFNQESVDARINLDLSKARSYVCLDTDLRILMVKKAWIQDPGRIKKY